MTDTLFAALRLLGSFDNTLVDIVWLSLRVSMTAVVLGALIGLPLGAWLAIAEFRWRNLLVVFVNGLMGLPSVVVGVGDGHCAAAHHTHTHMHASHTRSI